MKKLVIFTLLCTVLVASAEQERSRGGLTLEDIRVQYPGSYEHFKNLGKPDAIFSSRFVREINRLIVGNTLEDIRDLYPSVVYEYFKSQGNPTGVWPGEFVHKIYMIVTNQKTLTGPLTSGAGLTLEDVRVQYPRSYEKVKAAALEDPLKQWSVKEIENAGK